MPISLLSPERAMERIADLEGRAFFDGRRITPIILRADETEADRIRMRILRVWHDAHYNGRPTRAVERTLAFLRFAAAHGDDPEVDRVMRSEAKRLTAQVGR